MSKVYKKNKILFYIEGYNRGLFPARNYDLMIDAVTKKLSKNALQKVEERVDYYNKLELHYDASMINTTLKDLSKPKTPKAYYFDTTEFTQYFPQDLKISFAFGDVNTIVNIPSITKSRPILGDNRNNVLLNLDKARHFVRVDDDKKFNQKKNLMIGRAGVYQQHRIDFYKKYFDHPMCDIGQINKNGGNQKWIKPKTSIDNHLDYKFILSLEGNDVATNLKWIMSSNSIAVSPPLKMETWYMEGKLQPNEHFIGINENYDNLEDQLQYYVDHEKEAKEIILNAKRYRSQFDNKNIENLISLLILKKYFAYIR